MRRDGGDGGGISYTDSMRSTWQLSQPGDADGVSPPFFTHLPLVAGRPHNACFVGDSLPLTVLGTAVRSLPG